MAHSLVVFDFDGTLLDSLATITLVANETLARCGLPSRPAAEVRPLVGLPLARVMEGLGGVPDRIEELCRVYRELWDLAPPAPLFDGIGDVVREARAAGTALAVATNRRRPGLDRILSAHGLLECFGFLVGGSCVERRKPHPEPVLRALDHFGLRAGDALVVGDTSYDLEMGRAAGADTCGVTWGSHSRERLEEQGPRYVVDTVAELRDLLSS